MISILLIVIVVALIIAFTAAHASKKIMKIQKAHVTEIYPELSQQDLKFRTADLS